MEGEYIDIDTCKGVMKTVLDVFVILKAVVLVAVSVRAIVWICKRSFKSFIIVSILVLSIVLVISECFYRFSNANLRYRFIQNALA